jgi:hypothetical protein
MPGTVITQFDLSTSLFQHDVSQIRIGGAAGAVPEPATYAWSELHSSD